MAPILTTRTPSAPAMAERVRAGEPFATNGALRGEPGPIQPWGLGYLPAEYHDDVRTATYVVYSYSTPIAWKNADGTFSVPATKYSVTTSRHQTTARMIQHWLG